MTWEETENDVNRAVSSHKFPGLPRGLATISCPPNSLKIFHPLIWGTWVHLGTSGQHHLPKGKLQSREQKPAWVWGAVLWAGQCLCRWLLTRSFMFLFCWGWVGLHQLPVCPVVSSPCVWAVYLLPFPLLPTATGLQRGKQGTSVAGRSVA